MGAPQLEMVLREAEGIANVLGLEAPIIRGAWQEYHALDARANSATEVSPANSALACAITNTQDILEIAQEKDGAVHDWERVAVKAQGVLDDLRACPGGSQNNRYAAALEVLQNYIDDDESSKRLNTEGTAKLPSLEECMEKVRNSMSDKKLSDQDEHCIGVTWAFIERRLGNFS